VCQWFDQFTSLVLLAWSFPEFIWAGPSLVRAVREHTSVDMKERAALALAVSRVVTLINPENIGRPIYIFHMFFNEQLYEVREYMALP